MAEEQHLEGAGEAWTVGDLFQKEYRPRIPTSADFSRHCKMVFMFRKNPEAYTFQSVCGPHLVGGPHKDLAWV